VPDSHYLSIGEVLGLLLEDFPDVTISKIRFLESQGLIEPERTPSGYRKFYDHDVDLLRAILHEQRENFLPLKVIRDRIESGGIQGDATGGRTPPRGIRNVEVRSAALAPGQAPPAGPIAASAAEPRDSVFRRTDGGPEWADGRALIPGGSAGADGRGSATPITTSVPVTASVLQTPVASAPPPGAEPPPPLPLPLPDEREIAPAVATPLAPPSPSAPSPAAPSAAAPSPTPPAEPAANSAPARAAISKPARAEPAAAPAVPAVPTSAVSASDSTMPYSREEFCAAAHISSEQLDELESFGLIAARGTGRDAAYPPEAVEVATVAGRFLTNGIDARHLRAWRQSADRESALFEQRIMPLLRQRNPASRQLALDTLAELAELGGRLRAALIDSALRHHFDGT
jgi:DNA-binding transcriptional MerR regulator